MSLADSPVCAQLGMDYPLIQAPMAGGPTTPELIAAVCNAGALGSLGAGYLSPEQIREAITAIRELTSRPFTVNLMVPNQYVIDEEKVSLAEIALEEVYRELGVAPAAVDEPIMPDFEQQLQVLIEEGVSAASFTFGIPAPKYMEAMRDVGMPMIGTATHVLEAIALEEAGADIIVAQGTEAGGHRGTFFGHAPDLQIGTQSLVQSIVKEVNLPVVAAGGIMDGAGMVAAMMTGAYAVQLGTAFLCCDESGAHPEYKKALLDSHEVSTVLTRAFSGRWARAIRNDFTRALAKEESLMPDYPVTNAITSPLRKAAAAQNKSGYMSLWAGQGSWQCRSMPAAELIENLILEASASVHQFAGTKTGTG